MKLKLLRAHWISSLVQPHYLCLSFGTGYNRPTTASKRVKRSPSTVKFVHMITNLMYMDPWTYCEMMVSYLESSPFIFCIWFTSGYNQIWSESIWIEFLTSSVVILVFCNQISFYRAKSEKEQDERLKGDENVLASNLLFRSAILSSVINKN